MRIKTVAEDDSQFKLPLTAEAAYLIAAHPESGFTKMRLDDFEATRMVKLQPWGRIEGRTVYDGKPASGQEVLLKVDDSLRTDFSQFRATSDAAGRFQFDFVPPIEIALIHLESNGDRSCRTGSVQISCQSRTSGRKSNFISRKRMPGLDSSEGS